MRGRVRHWLDELDDESAPDDESALDDGLKLGGGLGLEAGLKPGGGASSPTGGLTLSLAFWRSSWSLFLSISSIARKPALTCSSSESTSVFIGWAASDEFPSLTPGDAFGVPLLVRCRPGFLPIAAISAVCFCFFPIASCSASSSWVVVVVARHLCPGYGACSMDVQKMGLPDPPI
jgi:hypothetical protein